MASSLKFLNIECLLAIIFLLFYFKYTFGFTWTASFSISKWRCASSAISNAAVFPTVPSDCPFSTFSPSTTNSDVNKFEYTVWNPLACSITIVNPYLGSFLIVFTVPASAAFTIVVLSALISIPVWVVHSFNVSEYTKLSTAKSFTISPSTGFVKFSSTTTSSVFISFVVVFVLLDCVILLVVNTFCLLTVVSSFVVFSATSFLDSLTVFPISKLDFLYFLLYL